MSNEMKKIDRKGCREHLADLLLDETYVASRPELAAHLAACGACSAELAELKATFAMLDQWEAPEPSPYFDSKLRARLREAAAAEPEGLWERMRSFLMFSTGRRLKPALAGALALVMIAGGGSLFVGIKPATPEAAVSPTVNDLKILDNNSQAFQQMDQLLDSSGDDNGAPPES